MDDKPMLFPNDRPSIRRIEIKNMIQNKIPGDYDKLEEKLLELLGRRKIIHDNLERYCMVMEYIESHDKYSEKLDCGVCPNKVTISEYHKLKKTNRQNEYDKFDDMYIEVENNISRIKRLYPIITNDEWDMIMREGIDNIQALSWIEYDLKQNVCRCEPKNLNDGSS